MAGNRFIHWLTMMLAGWLVVLAPMTRAQTPAPPATNVPVPTLDAARQMFEDGKWNEALQAFRTIRADAFISKRAGACLYYEGWCLFNLEKYAEAAGAFEELVANHPEFNVVPEATLKIAECRAKLKEYDKAMTAVLALEKKQPDAAAAPAPQVVLKFSHGEAPDSAPGKTADFFAGTVAKRSNGRIRVDVFHAGQLAGGGDVRVELERVQLGVIDITSSAGTLYFAAYDPRFNIVQLPYLFKDDAAYLKYIRSAPSAQEMLKAVEKNGFKALTFWPRPYRQLTNSKRLVRTPADMKGLKVRVPPVGC